MNRAGLTGHKQTSLMVRYSLQEDDSSANVASYFSFFMQIERRMIQNS